MAGWGRRFRIAVQGIDPRTGQAVHLASVPGASRRRRLVGGRRLAGRRRVAGGGRHQVRQHRGAGGALSPAFPPPRVPPRQRRRRALSRRARRRARAGHRDGRARRRQYGGRRRQVRRLRDARRRRTASRTAIGCSRPAARIGRSRPRRPASCCGPATWCTRTRAAAAAGASRGCAPRRSAPATLVLGFVSAQGGLRHVRIGIDVGGTFTDLVAVDAQGRVTLAKVAVDAGRPVARGDGGPRSAGGGARARPRRRCWRGPSGSSTARRLRPTRCSSARVRGSGLLTTEGHRDIIEMREGLKDDRYNLRQPPPVPAGAARAPARRARAHPADGRVEIALDRASLDAAIAELETPGRRGRRDLLPAQLARREPRARDRRGRARRHAGRLCLALRGGAAADQGVRARLHHRRQRLCRPGAGALPDAPRGAAARSGAARARC